APAPCLLYGPSTPRQHRSAVDSSDPIRSYRSRLANESADPRSATSECTAIPWLVLTRADHLSARRAIADAPAVVRREYGDRLDQLTDQGNRTEEKSHERPRSRLSDRARLVRVRADDHQSDHLLADALPIPARVLRGAVVDRPRHRCHHVEP